MYIDPDELAYYQCILPLAHGSYSDIFNVSCVRFRHYTVVEMEGAGICD